MIGLITLIWNRTWILFLVILFSMLNPSFYLKTKENVIKDFEDNKSSFEVVAEYIASYDLENSFDDLSDYTIKFFHYPDSEVDTDPIVYGLQENARILPCDESVRDAVKKLFAIGYITMGRYDCSGKTIVFEMDGYEPFMETYRLNGIAYALNGSKPKPVMGETAIDEIIDLGDGWYYYHGVSYPGHLDEGKTPIVFEK